MTVSKGSLVAPKDLKSGPPTRSVTTLIVEGGSKDQSAFGNRVLIVVTSPDSDIGKAILYQEPTFFVGSKRFGPPAWVPWGPYEAAYLGSVGVWDRNPTPDQTKLIDSCLNH